tara:strand:+ start:1575 stop:1682 length:108 start_codon:yes stop_codon:yes gene_type:complete
VAYVIQQVKHIPSGFVKNAGLKMENQKEWTEQVIQ